MKGWWKYAIAFALGALLCGGAVLYFTSRSGANLQRQLGDLRKSLASALDDNASLTSSVRQLHGQLDSANTIATGQQRELDADKQRLAGQQRTIDNQQSILAAQKRGLDAIAQNIAGAGGDIGKSIRAIAEGFRVLYFEYHPGAS
jgi:chromosome segregation ATPase